MDWFPVERTFTPATNANLVHKVEGTFNEWTPANANASSTFLRVSLPNSGAENIRLKIGLSGDTGAIWGRIIRVFETN